MKQNRLNMQAGNFHHQEHEDGKRLNTKAPKHLGGKNF